MRQRKPLRIPAPDTAATRIVHELESLAHYDHGHRLFNDFCDCTLKALRMLPHHLHAVYSQGRLAEDPPDEQPFWVELTNKYKSLEPLQRAFAILLASTEIWQDALGSAYMQFNIANQYSGQYFTPWNVALAMAEITIGGKEQARAAVEDRLAAPVFNPITINDPTCGSGIMLLAAASLYPHEYLHRGYVQFFGQDIDQLCVKMAQINMHLYGLNGTALWLPTTSEDVA